MHTYMLHLAVLHNEDPGVLDVVFGPDGDFEGAPLWMPSAIVVGQGYDRPHGRHAHGLVLWSVDPRGWTYAMWDELSFDLRIPTVAARLAGLCARALGLNGRGWHVRRDLRFRGDVWHLQGCRVSEDGADTTPIRLSWRNNAKPTHGQRTLAYIGSFDDDAAFLAALTIALAKRIAKLNKLESQR